MNSSYHSDEALSVFHQLLTLALAGELVLRDRALWIAGAPSTLIDQLATSILYYSGWLFWYPSPGGALIGRPTITGRRVLDAWDEALTNDITFTDADEQLFQRARFDVTPDDIKDRP